jgi:adenylosuccinate lyase
MSANADIPIASTTPPNLALPGNPRYQPKELVKIFGYDNLYRTVAEVEIATLITLGRIGVIPSEVIDTLTPEIQMRLLAITTTQVDKIEREVTKHDIRAWVRLAQEIVDPSLRRWIHVPLTSYDALDTARTLQFVRGHEVIEEMAQEVIRHLIALVRKYADTAQIGRTHGQHALPITVGFWLATVLNRIVANLQSANNAVDQLIGKISGAVGACNAQYGLGFSGKTGSRSFEQMVLAELGLKPGKISTQILQPEPLADYLFALTKLSASIGQFGLDGRNLMRSEIAEIGEPFEESQVGSSTMAQKRNPMTFENLQGTYLKTTAEFLKVLLTINSEHQRDLVGSSVARDFPTIVVNVATQLSTLLRCPKGKPDMPFISRITVNEAACNSNLVMAGDSVLAEPIYIALQMAGYDGDAHNLVSHKAIPYQRMHGGSLFEAACIVIRQEEVDITESIISKIPFETIELLGKPAEYTGEAAVRANAIADAAYRFLDTGIYE